MLKRTCKLSQSVSIRETGNGFAADSGLSARDITTAQEDGVQAVLQHEIERLRHGTQQSDRLIETHRTLSRSEELGKRLHGWKFLRAGEEIGRAQNFINREERRWKIRQARQRSEQAKLARPGIHFAGVALLEIRREVQLHMARTRNLACPIRPMPIV